MSTSPDLGLPYIAQSQSQPEVTHNTVLNQFQMMVNGVIDKDVSVPPVSPIEGDTYIVGPAPSGAWASRANCLAGYFGGAWVFLPDRTTAGAIITPGLRNRGLMVFVRDEEIFYVWGGTAWVSMGIGPLISI